MNNLDAVFVDVDELLPDFPPCIEKHLISSGIKQRNLLAF
ncbi:hypothetical protein BTN49_1296 [Candidatus Enterovibrio escicola]|uniref:Mobile element protein n=1 Tax=Candidatus Enterovibrio escicola TaxID=1927127 RepID=A0A2A5T544_9GAMM|nr:hypothetical protein BTN49_1296 [Candidatus Enterovibrio escacola]